MESVRIGTSGWHYKHWLGNFYPAGTPAATYLSYYVQHFNSVEINNSFYKLPSTETLTDWLRAVPENFLFAIKASRFITHMKKLKEPQQSMALFLERIQVLGEKLGPVLFQLPPSWRFNQERFASFLQALPTTCRYAFEFRDQSWYTDSTYQLLQDYNCAFCIYDFAYHQSPVVITTDFVYVRLHGPENKYDGSYSDQVLSDWASRSKMWISQGKQVYIYFDNDIHGHAPVDAQRLQQMLQNYLIIQ
jgi:uncharacterized protein YecE (DUF72 family)